MLDKLFKPQSVALIGASDRPGSFGCDARYTGPLDAAAMRQAYLEADVFLLPSCCENSPNSLPCEITA